METCIFKILTLLLVAKIWARDPGCANNDWECDEDHYCQKSQNRCKPCSVVEHACQNITVIEANYKKCLQYCFNKEKLRADHLNLLLQNKTDELQRVQIELDNKTTKLQIALSHAQSEQGSNTKLSWYYIPIGGVCFILGILFVLAVQKLRACKAKATAKKEPEDTDVEEQEDTQMKLLTGRPGSRVSDGYETGSSPSATPPPARASPQPCQNSSTVTHPVSNDMGAISL